MLYFTPKSSSWAQPEPILHHLSMGAGIVFSSWRGPNLLPNLKSQKFWFKNFFSSFLIMLYKLHRLYVHLTHFHKLSEPQRNLVVYYPSQQVNERMSKALHRKPRGVAYEFISQYMHSSTSFFYFNFLLLLGNELICCSSWLSEQCTEEIGTEEESPTS